VKALDVSQGDSIDALTAECWQHMAASKKLVVLDCRGTRRSLLGRQVFLEELPEEFGHRRRGPSSPPSRGIPTRTDLEEELRGELSGLVGGQRPVRPDRQTSGRGSALRGLLRRAVLKDVDLPSCRGDLAAETSHLAIPEVVVAPDLRRPASKIWFFVFGSAVINRTRSRRFASAWRRCLLS
jgi:hypothetical protein